MPCTYPSSQGDSTPFPYRQLTILALCRLAEPIAFMSIFPYIYYMIESFHITEDTKRIAFYAGMVTSAFALAEALSGSIWGGLSDKYGRKIILLSGLAGTGISMIAFGFAQSLPAAVIARALGGLLNGNIGVLQTTVQEVVKDEKHKGVGFALMPAIWCIGTVLGAAVGGGLADPVRNYPGIFSTNGIFGRFPYLLPNLVCAGVVVVAILVGVLFLEETHYDMQDRSKDMGLRLGMWIESIVRRTPSKQALCCKSDISGETLVLLDGDDLPPDYRSAASSPGLQATDTGLPPYTTSERGNDALHATAPFALSPGSDMHKSVPIEKNTGRRGAGFWNAITPQLMLVIVAYGILAYHTMSAEQLLPVLFSLPESDTPAQLPFWFTGGFGMTTKAIGGILSVQGAIQIFSTLILFPIVNSKLGPLLTYRIVVLSYPLLYIVVPYLTLVPVSLRMPAVYAILVWKVTAQAFAIPANNLMLARAIPRDSLGTFNGVANSSASFARAIGPSLSGLLEAAGLSRGMLGLPWWFTACVAVLGAALSLFMTDARPTVQDPEKRDLESADGNDSSTNLAAEINAALVAASTVGAHEAGDMSRPTSPMLMRFSHDLRRGSRS